MAAPNIVNVTNIVGNTGVLNCSTSATAIVTNAAASNAVYKINSLYISNNDAAVAYKVTIDLYRSTTAYPLGVNISIPNGSTLDVVSKSIYLIEGDSLRITAEANSKLVAVCSYEEIR